MLVLRLSIYAIVLNYMVAAADSTMPTMINPARASLLEKRHWNNLLPPSPTTYVSKNPRDETHTTPFEAAKEKREDEPCISVHLCTEKDWKGDCWWACFRDGLETYPNWDWGNQVKSARPGEDATCKFFFGPDCSMRTKKQDMEWPGGNLEGLGDFGIGCFYCMKKGSKKSYSNSK
ncbi:hypothetical protein CSAL01_07857 [Colletotrichum salicis]|uniref:Uncharacterized protein n=1 Tax=Colletotrichum salicis TaxID=1209931 RepID=A0A135T0E6_9PEZI|nr:hypothetical protein CSAL01_07857 [Colletotrichum salicis]